MKHLVVICHPRRESFTQAVARRYGRLLKDMGNDVVVRDLYRMGFDPVLGEGELMDRGRPRIPAAIRREQRHLAEAGAVAFFYPLWWAFMPAMMKGYVDRVLAAGVGYDAQTDQMTPRLTGKKALIFTSSAADMAYLRRSGQWKSMRLLGGAILSLCGIELLDHIHFASVLPGLSERSVERHLATVAEAAREHWGKVPPPQG